jgi:hypothetical protein
VTASELVFLILGLGLGVVTGAAIVEVFRSRPPVPRQVRVTIQADAIPRRRAATLSEDAFLMAGPEPARGGPADRRETLVAMPADGVDRRTIVRSDPPEPRRQPLIGIPVVGGDDPVLAALRVQAVSAAMRDGDAPAGTGHTLGATGFGPTDGGLSA